MSRPVIKIKMDTFDWIIEIIGFIGLVVLIALPLYFYDKLPETIPSHFNFMGDPDGFSSKSSIWLLPGIGFGLYFFLLIINRFPHKFNYLQEIDENNAGRQYTLSTKMIRVINMIIVYIFVYITYASIQTALRHQNGLGSYFTLIFIASIFIPIAVYLYYMNRK